MSTFKIRSANITITAICYFDVLKHTAIICFVNFQIWIGLISSLLYLSHPHLLLFLLIGRRDTSLESKFRWVSEMC